MTTSQMDAVSTQRRAKSNKNTQTATQILIYRLMITYRFLLAMLGGYILSALSAILIADAFAEDRASGAMAATLIAFSLWTAAFIWVFMVNKTLKASLGIMIPSIALFIMYKLLGH